MTSPDIRAVNRAICLLGDEHQDEREEARAALHRIFRKQVQLETLAKQRLNKLKVARRAQHSLAARVEQLQHEDLGPGGDGMPMRLMTPHPPDGIW